MFTILNINRVDGEAGGGKYIVSCYAELVSAGVKGNEYIVSCHAELVSAGVKGNEYIVSCHAELVSASYRLVITRQIGKVLKGVNVFDRYV